MVGPAVQAAKGTSGMLAGAKKLLTVSAITVYLVLILSHSLFEAIQQKSAAPVVVELGKRFVGVTQDLSEQSESITAHQGVYDGSAGKFKGALNAFLTYAIFLSTITFVFLWIRLLAWIVEHTVSDSTSQLRNHILAVGIFYVIQVVYLLLTAEGADKLSLLYQPFGAFVHFWHALPYLISPAVQAIETVENSPIANSTIGKLV